MRRDCAPTWIPGKNEYRPLRRVELAGRVFDESYLQETLHACPWLLPVDELDPDYGPLVSLGREVMGIDNLFIAPSGRLTIAETKLWRNPQATRETASARGYPTSSAPCTPSRACSSPSAWSSCRCTRTRRSPAGA